MVAVVVAVVDGYVLFLTWWLRGELRMVPQAGHALAEPGITAELVRITRAIYREAGKFGF